MKSIPPVQVVQVLKQYGLWATKGLGQNFLEDAASLQQIVEAADIHESDIVLEVGPGLGSLTRYLCLHARQVVAVELDRKLVPVLKGILKSCDNVRIVEGDILALSPGELQLPNGYLVAANIPYNITSALLHHLLSSHPMPRRIVLTVQKEVAERICSQPPDMSLLSLSVQVYGDPTIAARIPAAAFYPVPKVDSAVIRIDVLPSPRISRERLPTFFELIKAAFSQKRKMLHNALSSGMRIPVAEAQALLLQAGVDPKRRAETLNLEEWDALIRAWETRGRTGSSEPV